jgi:ribosomal protein S1
MNYGCFIELRPEVWGLLHRDRWSRSYEVADRVAVRVESVDPALRKIELSEIH